MSVKQETSPSTTCSVVQNNATECSGTPSRTMKKKHELQGGFDCVFVEEPPKQVQTDCSICLCVLKDPYLVDCCGISFCQSCIKPIQDDSKPCPVCNVNFATCIPDKRLQRTLNEMKVYCSNKEFGCRWIGELGKLSQHLNTKSETNDRQVDSCLFTPIECIFCGKNFQRKDLEEHKSKRCLQRPYSCDYCNNYESTCEDVTSNHWPVCPSRPVPCPNKCGLYRERQNLASHVDKECPLTVLDCSFRYAGCMERICRRDMQDHIASDLAKHMSLQTISNHNTVQSLKSENSELRELIRGLERKLKEQETNLEMRFTQLQEDKQALEEQLKKQATQVNEQQQQTEDSLQQIEALNQHTTALQQQMKMITVNQIEVNSHIGIAPLDLTLRNFSALKQLKKNWPNESFYTHSRGYRLCLCIYPNGAGEGKRTHVSMYIYLMKGAFDDALKWPMRGVVNILILNDDETKHHVCQIRFVEKSDKLFDRLRLADVTSRGWGCPTVIDHASLEAGFLTNDCLRLRVLRMELV